MHTLIVGNGPAALAAVEAIREKDRDSTITMVSAEVGPAYTPCFLAKYVAGTAGPADLTLRSEDFYEHNRVELLVGHAVTSVLTDEGVVVLDDGTRLAYDRLLLANGAEPVMPDGPDLSGPGVFVFRTMADAVAIRERAEKAQNVFVLGSGFVAMEVAEALTEAGASVTVIARRDRILRRIFDPEVAGLVETHMSANGVRFLKEHDLTGVERAPGTGELTAVVFSDGERFPCDMLVVGIGMRPRIGPVAGTAITTGRGILTDAAMRTSVPGVYAAGDVAEAEIDGIRKSNLIHPNAVATGHIAGYNMAGGDQRMSAHLADMNVLTLFGRSFLAVGALEGHKVLKRSWGRDGRVKVFADEAGFIRGVELVGDVTRGGLYASLIARNVNLSAVPDLLEPTFNYAETSGQAARAS